MSALPYTPWPGCETHEWRSPLGDVVRFVTRVEAQQRMMPPVEIQTIRVPQSQGGRFRGARHAERVLILPVVIPGPQTDRAELRRWAKALDPRPGLGTLTVVDGSNAGRQLVCCYEAGLEEFTEEEPGIGLGVLAFRAPYPYWVDATERTFHLDTGSAAYTWFPFPPLVLAASDVFGVGTIQNVGDVEAWPVVRVTGPGTTLSLQNLTTGQQLTLTGSVAAGSAAVIDTRPGQKLVTVDGVNVFGRLSDDSTLWPLGPGANRVQIGFTGATGATSVDFTWRNAWMAA